MRHTEKGLDRFTSALGNALVEHARTLPAPPVRRRWVPRRRWAVLVATIAAAVAAVLVLTPDPDHPATPSLARAAAVLRGAANVLAAQPPQILGAGQYYYQQSEGSVRPTDRPSITETWRERDGSGRALVDGQMTTVQPPSESDPFALGSATVSYATLLALPTEPAALQRALVAMANGQQARVPPAASLLRGGPGKSYALFTILRDAFEAPAPPRLRAALYNLLATLPGLRLEGQMTDHRGRTGIAVSTVLGAVRFRIIVSPATGQLLETQRILIRPSHQLGDARPGLFSWATYLRAAVVASAYARPR